jgi:hypothetical protein
MLDVFFTVDVEVWCDGWTNLNDQFNDSFRKYIYGPTAQGNFGLPYKLKVLADHGLIGVFFVETLFAARFGNQPLQEITGLIQDAGQEIQLHLHTEWVDESNIRLLENVRGKRQHMFQFSQVEQSALITIGKALLEEALRGDKINCFRAGSYGFNRDTLIALAQNGIVYDSSYNATRFGMDSGVAPGTLVLDTLADAGVIEYPKTVFDDGTRLPRHVQLTACSFAEIETLLWQALEAGRKSFVISSHNFELLNMAKTRPDDVVVKRFHKLCAFLERNRDVFRVGGFNDLYPQLASFQPPMLSSSRFNTGGRMLAQAYRRIYG